MDQQNNVRIDVVGSVDGFSPAADEAARDLDKLKSSAQAAGQEMGNLARGALSEATAGMGELGVVAERAVLSAASLGTGFLAVTVGLAAYAAASREGREEQLAMEHALTMTGNAAGLTRSQMMEMAQGVEQATTLTIKQSKNLITEIVASGKIAGEAVGAVALLSDNYANATGAKLDTLAPKLVSLFEDPAKGAAKLNETMHFLTIAQLEYIQTLVDSGREGEAQLDLANRLNEVLPRHAQELGALETVWNGLRKAASGAWDAMLAVGREDTLQEKLDKAKEAAANSSEWWRQFRDFDGKVAVYQAAVDEQNAAAATAKQAADDQVRETKANALIERLTKAGQKNAIAQKMQEAAALMQPGAQLDEILGYYRDQIVKVDAVKGPKAKKEKPDDSAFKERLQQLRDEAKAEADLLNQRQKADALLDSYGRQDAMTVQRIARSAELAAMSERERTVAEAVYAAQDKSAQRQEQIIKQIGDETERTRALTDEKDLLARQIDAVTAAAEKSYDAQRSFEFGWNKALQRYQDDATNAANGAAQVFGNAVRGMEDALTQFAMTGKISFSSLATSIIADIVRMQARAASSGIMSALSGLVTSALGNYSASQTYGTSFGSEQTSILASQDAAFSGTRAGGGGVEAYKTYLVGESGPELIRMGGGSGTVIPNHALGGGGEVTVIINNQSGGQTSTQERSDGRGGKIIEVLIEQVKSSLAGDISSGNGAVPAAMQGAYGLNRRAGAY